MAYEIMDEIERIMANRSISVRTALYYALKGKQDKICIDGERFNKLVVQELQTKHKEILAEMKAKGISFSKSEDY